MNPFIIMIHLVPIKKTSSILSSLKLTTHCPNLLFKKKKTKQKTYPFKRQGMFSFATHVL